VIEWPSAEPARVSVGRGVDDEDASVDWWYTSEEEPPVLADAGDPFSLSFRFEEDRRTSLRSRSLSDSRRRRLTTEVWGRGDRSGVAEIGSEDGDEGEKGGRGSREEYERAGNKTELFISLQNK
jgi:hypothetical protein